MHRFLSTMEHRIVVCEQVGSDPFNKGALLNAGYVMVKDAASWICFHDVDMLPDNELCDYSRPHSFAHAAGKIEQFDYQCPYRNYFGGVILSTKEAYEFINGFSNSYWGYGYEDDDMFCRVKYARLPIERRYGRFRSLPHRKGSAEAGNLKLWHSMQKGTLEWRSNGLRSVNFSIVSDTPLLSLITPAHADDRLLKIDLSSGNPT